MGGRVEEEVVDRPGDAVALRLTRDDDGVEAEQVRDQRLVPSAENLALGSAEHLRPENRVVLRQWAAALELESGLRLPRDGVEEDRLLDRAHERVADAAEERVEGPHRQVVLPGRGEGRDVGAQVVACMALPE